MSKKIQFSIEEFNKRGGIGKCKVVTRDNMPVRVLCTDGPFDKQPVICACDNWVSTFTLDGYYAHCSGSFNLYILDESEPKWREWTFEEFPLRAEFREIGFTARNRPLCITSFSGASFVEKGSIVCRTMEWLKKNAEHSLDGGKTWQPCGVKEGE